MGTERSCIVPLADAGRCADDAVGGKARTLGRLIEAGYRVPRGFCIDVSAYERFVEAADLIATITMELGRKRFSTMRWEEIWDAALRIRSAFLAAPIPADVAREIVDAYHQLGPISMAVRSSSPGEDSAERSHAGLHESLVGVETETGLLDGVKIVWASLWSDAALLYRRELNLDVHQSRMAVVVQEFVAADLSGVGFGIDPREPRSDRQVVEAVPGRCEDLVSGAVDPDRWIMKRSSGEIVEWTPGTRDDGSAKPILERDDLKLLHQTLHSVETLLGFPPDVEWTGKHPELTVLQARPVTGVAKNDDGREWYLSLRPGGTQLRELCRRVTEELIPELESEAAEFADEGIEDLSDANLAGAIEARLDAVNKWNKTYRDDFIPFAHGARSLGVYYNDAVRPEDPYEFVRLLESQPMIASERNAALEGLAAMVRNSRPLAAKLTDLVASEPPRSRSKWNEHKQQLRALEGADDFVESFESFLDRFMDISHDGESLDDRPDLTLNIALELAASGERSRSSLGPRAAHLEQRLLDAVGPDRKEEALDLLRIGRLSWRLRDDDNILMGRLQNQLQHTLALAAERLTAAGRLEPGASVSIDAAPAIVSALRGGGAAPVVLPHPVESPAVSSPTETGTTPRQMIGQPASPGFAAGLARIVRDASDFESFRGGEVMVCDAIQPTMTHLVPLACAIVERRGGMLIHGAIIARELGVPCVNGVPGAAELLRNGDLVTVDGHLGIVTVGPPEFELERRR